MTRSAIDDKTKTTADGRLVSSHRIGRFVTQVTRRMQDGKMRVIDSRSMRKGFAPTVVDANGVVEEPKHRAKLLVWAPSRLNWWIGLLFMIGSMGFILGSLVFLSGSTNYFLMNCFFFGGSIFFTSAGYSQYNQAINAGAPKGSKRIWFAFQPWRIDYWITFTQFVGTVFFNFNTFDAFLGLGYLGQDLTIWVPDFLGSILFQISGTLALMEIYHGAGFWKNRSISWWITVINFIGCVAFLISSFFAFVRPDPIFSDLAHWATVFTLIGAICFFVGAYLMWPEMSLEGEA